MVASNDEKIVGATSLHISIFSIPIPNLPCIGEEQLCVT